jgi:hypothetical protein
MARGNARQEADFVLLIEGAAGIHNRLPLLIPIHTASYPLYVNHVYDAGYETRRSRGAGIELFKSFQIRPRFARGMMSE